MPPSRSASLLVCLAVAVGCSGPPDATNGPEQSGDPGAVVTGGTPTTSGIENETPLALPDPDATLPRDPGRLAERFAQTTRSLHEAIEAWRASGGTSAWPPPRPVVVLALDQQRAVQLLASWKQARRDAAFTELPAALRPLARDATHAGSRLNDGLAGHFTDVPIEMRTVPPLPPDRLRVYYREASRRFGVPWTLLAAVHFMETKFGRVTSPSWAGAQGPMQFIPSTWEAFGMGGDIHDTRDAINAAANYLSATGSPGDDRAALWAYNPVDYYGDAVLAYDRMMRRDDRAFYTLYNWQVFVRTRAGLVQLTGPGADVRSST
jgi:Transglycosylase SLT domain